MWRSEESFFFSFMKWTQIKLLIQQSTWYKRVARQKCLGIPQGDLFDLASGWRGRN
jgi:hypothetical protein